MCIHKWIGIGVLLILLVSSLAWAKNPTAKITIKSIPPAEEMQDVKGNPIVTSGLSNVGKGTYVFLEAKGKDPDGSSIVSYQWKLSGRPGGSNATLSDSGSKVISFIPDVVGEYTVELIVTDGQGEKSPVTTVNITAGTWSGVGTIGGAKPDFEKGQCGICHKEKAENWAKTGHATMFQEGINGVASSHYSEACINCHTVGFNVAADNSGFDDVATKLEWKFPEKLQEENWDTFVENYPELAQLTNIQCENCHGPGSEHKGYKAKIALSLQAGVCGQCHDAPTHHVKNLQWKQSSHSRSIHAAGGVVVTQDRCVHCMTGQGLVYEDIKAANIEDPVSITCSACHDPHSTDSKYQLRLYGEIKIRQTTVDADLAAICMRCHNAEGAEVGHEPHHPQSEMLLGVGGYEYSGEIYVSGAHSKAIKEKCVACHMSPTPEKGPGANKIGEHTWKMESEDVYNVSGCKSCHGPLDNFNVNKTQTRIKNLLAKIEELLPRKDGEVLVESTDEIILTSVQKKAAFNYYFVKNDGSFGVHNPSYAEKLLLDSIKSLTVGFEKNTEKEN